ncbi:DUF2199 domain-containing protein [Fulvivirgaceae bacterium BMA10]|uniref:DUF2199 domain-containing protein n=1 Tax=Splendidivirga corallicola TaxID=3051826 RepID=A0ABT8KR34_9BACT|nr:DUF2199 domain-containing protein [Fulvivirgaceae bacterium BMA10]
MKFSINKIFKKPEKFSIPMNTGVYTTKFVMHGSSTITFISHELDGDWQFMGDEPVGNYQETGMLVSLEELIKKDNSITQVADLPIGYQATRKAKNEDWSIEKIEYSEDEMKEFGFYCVSCGLYHKDLPMAYESDGPEQYFQIPESQREMRSDITQDTYVLDEKSFFIKGQIRIPVSDSKDDFAWNVWIEITEDDFTREQEQWLEENRFLSEPYSGTLDTQLTCYPNTIGLNVKIRTQQVGIIPIVELEESNHPLSLEQEIGINKERVTDFAKKLVYGHG